MMKVEIAFDLSANGQGNFFTLDDPIKGVLGGTASSPLAGDVLTDVTEYVRTIQVKRGRSRTLEKFTAGIANVALDNRGRDFDPLYSASPFFGNIGPRKQIQISDNNELLFVGNVEDWDFSYSPSGDSVAEVQALDGFAVITPEQLNAGTATSQLTGARVGEVLDDIGWPLGQRRISTGRATLDADVVAAGTNSLAYLQKVELSEPGALFIGRDGFFTFLDRDDLQTYTSAVTFGTAGIPFTNIGVVFGTEEMTNAVTVTYYGGTAIGGTVTASDAASQAAYGVINQTYDTLLDTATDAQELADWLVGTYAEPRYRVDSLTVNVSALSTVNAATVEALELGDTVLVQWTPNGIGSAISQYVTIDGIEHAASPANHDVTFNLSQATVAFTLDDTFFGILDNNVLGF